MIFLRRDIISNLDIHCGKLKIILYKTIYKHHLKYGKGLLCSGSIRFRCKEGKISISDNVKINSSTILHTSENGIIDIGVGTGINHKVIIVAKKRISIGRNVMIGPNVCIYDHDHIYKTNRNMIDSGFKTGIITIEDNVWIGANCVILRDSHIGYGSVIAAGSVVKGEIPPNSIFYNERRNIIKSKG